MLTSGITLVPIYSEDNEFFRKRREIWDKTTELIGINNPKDFVEDVDDDDDDDDDVMMVFNNFPQTSLV